MDDVRAMIDVVNSISTIYKKNSTETARDKKLCEHYVKLSELIAIAYPIFLSMAAIVYQLPVFLNIFANGMIRPSLSVYLPDVNPFDTIDMRVLLLVNVMFMVINMLVVMAIETFFDITLLTIPMCSTIIQRQINDFENDLKDKKALKNVALVKGRFVEIIMMQLNYNEYMNLKRLFAWCTFETFIFLVDFLFQEYTEDSKWIWTYLFRSNGVCLYHDHIQHLHGD